MEDGTIWSAAYTNLKVRCCYSPPIKKLIWDALVADLAKDELKLGIVHHTKVSKDWLLLMLSTRNPEHKFFQPDYYPKESDGYHMAAAQAASLAQIPGFRSSQRHVQMAQANLRVADMAGRVAGLS